MNNLSALIRRNLLLNWRSPWDVLLILFFFLASGALFPLGINERLDWLSDIAGGISMTLAMLAALLSMERLFLLDYEDGSLDLMSLSLFSFYTLAILTSTTHWISTLLPLILAMPLLGIILGVKPEHLWLILFFCLLATPALSLLGSFGAALILGSKRTGLLMIAMILPLFVPYLVFSSLGIAAGFKNEEMETYILLLVGLNLIAFAALPWATAFALKDAIRH